MLKNWKYDDNYDNISDDDSNSTDIHYDDNCQDTCNDDGNDTNFDPDNNCDVLCDNDVDDNNIISIYGLVCNNSQNYCYTMYNDDDTSPIKKQYTLPTSYTLITLSYFGTGIASLFGFMNGYKYRTP